MLQRVPQTGTSYHWSWSSLQPHIYPAGTCAILPWSTKHAGEPSTQQSVLNWNSMNVFLMIQIVHDHGLLARRSVACRQKPWEHLFRQRFGRPNPDRTPACWKHLFRSPLLPAICCVPSASVLINSRLTLVCSRATCLLSVNKTVAGLFTLYRLLQAQSRSFHLYHLGHAQGRRRYWLSERLGSQLTCDGLKPYFMKRP